MRILCICQTIFSSWIIHIWCTNDQQGSLCVLHKLQSPHSVTIIRSSRGLFLLFSFLSCLIVELVFNEKLWWLSWFDKVSFWCPEVSNTPRLKPKGYTQRLFNLWRLRSESGHSCETLEWDWLAKKRCQFGDDMARHYAYVMRTTNQKTELGDNDWAHCW